MEPQTLPGVGVWDDGTVYLPPPPDDDLTETGQSRAQLSAELRQHLDDTLNGLGDERLADYWQQHAGVCDAIAAYQVARGKADQARKALRAAAAHRKKARMLYVSAASKAPQQLTVQIVPPGRARSTLSGGRPAGSRRVTTGSSSSGDPGGGEPEAEPALGRRSTLRWSTRPHDVAGLARTAVIS